MCELLREHYEALHSFIWACSAVHGHTEMIFFPAQTSDDFYSLQPEIKPTLKCITSRHISLDFF